MERRSNFLFGHGMKEILKRPLDDNSSLNDIFVVSKIIRFRLNGIAEYLGGKLADTRNRESLSLHLQRVVAARHMAIHGEFVTLSEVYLNVRYLMSILTALNCGKAQVSLLQQIATKIAHTFRIHSKSNSFHMVSVPTVLKTMLYRSLEEFEKEFTEYFEPQKKAQDVALLSPK